MGLEPGSFRNGDESKLETERTQLDSGWRHDMLLNSVYAFDFSPAPDYQFYLALKVI